MFELKLIALVNRMYRGIIDLGLVSLNRRDKRALKKLNNTMRVSDDLGDLGVSLVERADAMADAANAEYSRKQLDINAAYNTLQNMRDDLTTPPTA